MVVAVVPGMALHAKEGLRDLQERLIGRAVRFMAVGAIFGYIRMLVNEGPLVFHVATCAESLGSDALEIFVVGREVRIVTVGTGHFMLGNRVMRELREFHLDLGMTACTELLLLVPADFLLRSLVQLVTVKTADVVQCMHARIPAGEVWR